jgi:hypothetical protein
VQCNAGEVSVSEASSTEETSAAAVEDNDAGNWLPVIPIEALPKGERRLVRQDGATVLLLWYKNDVYAIENTSPAEGAYSEGLVNARLTPVVLLFILLLLCFPSSTLDLQASQASSSDDGFRVVHTAFR